MNHTTNLVYVYYQTAQTRQLMGRLLFKHRQIFFEYDGAFIGTGLELSPFTLPLRSGVIASQDPTFSGLFGVFNDSLPDGWGRLLLDRKMTNLGFNPEVLTPLDRLCFVGQGMGALSYEPEHSNSSIPLQTDLDEIDQQIQATLQDSDLYVENLLTLGGSSAGARPKVLLRIDHEDWLIKFRSSSDPQDISAIEYAYHLMARKAGLDVPEAKLFPSRKGLGFFGVKRFDRNKHEKIHMHTVAGLLHADHRDLSLDYETIMKATMFLTRDVRQCEIQFRNAVFNVLSHNRDDHAKNFSFLMKSDGIWSVSPAYDLTFSSGPSKEHCTMIMGEGKNPTQKHLLELASIGSIKQDKALEIIDQVFASTRTWHEVAEIAGVSPAQAKNIGVALESVSKRFR